MEFGVGSYIFGLLAGVLSTLSPCVLPIVPILLGSAANAHPRAPLALASGLAISYAFTGTTLAWAGTNLGIDVTIFRVIAAVILGILGIILMSTSLQGRFAVATSNISNAGNNLLAKLPLDGLKGQFIIGLVLGIVWSPCVGPTLGAAILMASQGTSLLQVMLLMGVFGVGAALPIVVLAHLSRNTMLKVRDKLLLAGKTGKVLLGLVMLILSAGILIGFDKQLETWLVVHSPQWLTTLTTRF